jgi:hypothetical protein
MLYRCGRPNVIFLDLVLVKPASKGMLGHRSAKRNASQDGYRSTHRLKHDHAERMLCLGISSPFRSPLRPEIA